MSEPVELRMVRIVGVSGASSFEPAPVQFQEATMEFSERFEVSMDFSTSVSAEVDRETQIMMAMQLRRAGLI